MYGVLRRAVCTAGNGRFGCTKRRGKFNGSMEASSVLPGVCVFCRLGRNMSLLRVCSMPSRPNMPTVSVRVMLPLMHIGIELLVILISRATLPRLVAWRFVWLAAIAVGVNCLGRLNRLSEVWIYWYKPFIGGLNINGFWNGFTTVRRRWATL